MRIADNVRSDDFDDQGSRVRGAVPQAGQCAVHVGDKTHLDGLEIDSDELW
jgi:hypothetical protein